MPVMLVRNLALWDLQCTDIGLGVCTVRTDVIGDFFIHQKGYLNFHKITKI